MFGAALSNSTNITLALPDIVSIGICPPTKTNRAVAVEKLLEKGATGQPHPTPSVDAPVRIKQQFFKDLRKERPPISICEVTAY